MSKAFTNEDTQDLPPVRRAAPRLAPGEVRYITPEGHAELSRQLEAAEAERLAVSALPESERASRLDDLKHRAAVLEATLGVLTVLGPEQAPEGRVAFGSWVVVEDDEGRRSTWRIVGPDEVEPRGGLVSAHSPVARALLGRQAGDVVEVRRPTGLVELEILEVRRTAPDSA